MNYYIVNAFTSDTDAGNPAGICLLDAAISDERMQKIAASQNLSETAFILPKAYGYQLRWFTPTFEIDLCGHATLAAAFVLFHDVEREARQIQFATRSGELTVRRSGALYEMQLPCRPPEKIAPPCKVIDALGLIPEAVYAERDLYVILPTEEAVRNFRPNYEKFQLLTDWLGIVITAKGEKCDFVSRYFCPELKLEDPVTGSAHCSLIPLWHRVEEKTTFVAKQISARGGTLYCQYRGDTVTVAGEAVLSLAAEL